MSDEMTARHAAQQAQGKHLIIAFVGAIAFVVVARALADSAIHAWGPRPAVVAPAVDTAAIEAAREREEAAARAERKRVEQQMIAEETKRREEKKAEMLRAREAAAAAQQAADERREEAWNRFYKPATKCRTPADDAARVDCSNQYMRAREKFDKQYVDREQ